MKFAPLLLLAALAVPAHAAPVHVALKSAAAVSPNADGFFTLGSVADLTGGETAAADSPGRRPRRPRPAVRRDPAADARRPGPETAPGRLRSRQSRLCWKARAQAEVTTAGTPRPQ